MIIFAVATALLGAPLAQAGDYLPIDRTLWWDAEPPHTAKFTRFDTIEGWFHEPLLHVFDPDAGNGDPRAVFIRPVSGNPPIPTQLQVVEDGSRVTRRVIRNGPDVPITGEPGTPFARPPMKLDFPIPQRAVVVEFGLQCHEGFDCSEGFDPSDIELTAFDSQGYVIQRTSLWQQERNKFVEELRTDLRLGVRDQEAKIVSISLTLRGSRDKPVNAVQLLRRVYQETLPPAATTEVAVSPGAPLNLTLPFRCDQVTVVSRGFRLLDTSGFLSGLLSFTTGIDAVVSDDKVIVTSSGEHVINLGNNGEQDFPVAEVYGSVLCWDSTQVELNAYSTTTIYAGTNDDATPQSVLDPCRNGACGSNPPPPLAMIAGHHFDWRPDPDHTASRNLFLAQGYVPTTANPDPVLVDLGGWLLAELAITEDESRFFQGHLERVVFGGHSLTSRSNTYPSNFNIPDMYTLPSSIPGSPRIQYPHHFMEELGYFCQIDATIALVGAEAIIVHPVGNGGTTSDRRAFIHELDVEIRARFIDDRVRIAVRGGIDIGESFSENPYEGEHGQIFATPACIGVSAVFNEGQPVAEALLFSAVPGQPQPPHDGGALRNIGVVPFTIHAVNVAGDDADFKLEALYNGARYGDVENIGKQNSLVMKPGNVLQVDGLFSPTDHRRRQATIKFETNVGGGTTVEMPVIGRVPEPIAWVPEQRNFGLVEEGESHTLASLLLPQDVISVTVNSLSVEQDDHGDFSVDGVPGQVLHPGDSLAVRATFQPTSLEPRERSAVLIADTDVGVIEMPLLGAVMPPPEPAAEWSQSIIQFGLQYEGIDSDAVVELRSTGWAPLQINNIYLVGHQDFSLPAMSFPVERSRGTSLLVTVMFTPFQSDDETDSPQRSATLVADTDAGPLTIDVTGFLAPPRFL